MSDNSPVVSMTRRKGRLQQARRDNASGTTSLTLHGLCLALTLLAAVIFTLTEHDAAEHHHSIWCTVEITLQSLVTLTAAVLIRRNANRFTSHATLQAMLVMTVILSLLCEPVQRWIFGTGKSFEILIMHSQSNLMLALAACGHRISFQRLAVLISVFLTIFCCSISNAAVLLPLATLFTICCLAWLTLAWWESLNTRQLLSRSSTNWQPAWLLLGLPLLVALLVGSGSNTAISALRGFMPGSGGTDVSDPFSRGGVHDGDHLVAGKDNVTSFAPIEGAPFLDSDKPSLYDVFNDTFDPPPRKIRKQQRAIALPPDLLMHVHQQMADAKNAGRQFSLTRGEPKKDQERPEDLNTHALMHVAGRTPLHLRMEVYDLFDGVTWYPIATDSEAVRVERPLRPSGIQHWLQLDVAGRGLEIHGPPESRGIRLLNLGGNVLPLPPHTTELSIERVDRADMYRVLPGQRVGLARDDIPEMTTVNIVSEAVDRDLLRSSDSLALVPWSSGSAGVLPSGFEDVKELAASITASVPHGWQQVEAISEYVRTRHELDRSARIPEDSPSPVHHFLFETQRGPEYMFAASTAALLRSAGYAARLVSGFYVHPDKYDPRLQHTPVHARDSHFWCEVSVGSNAWIMVDASPGYVEEDAPQGFWERLTNTVVAILVWLKSRWLWLSGAALVAIFTYRHRVSLQDRWLSIRWKWLRPSCPRRAVQTLSRITEWRLQQAGFNRSGRPTLHRVAGSVNVTETSSALSALASLFDWAAYSPVDESSGIEATALDAQLNALQDTLNLKHLTELAKETRAGAPRQSDDTRATRASGRRQRQHAAAASTTTSS